MLNEKHIKQVLEVYPEKFETYSISQIISEIDWLLQVNKWSFDDYLFDLALEKEEIVKSQTFDMSF
jgi:hypothetical protein